MKSSHLLLLLGICGAGLGVGFTARRISGSSAPSAESSNAVAVPEPAKDRPSHPGSPQAPDRRPGTQGVPKLQHQDSIGSLLALDPGHAYARTAIWLATAGEEEIQAFWEALSKTEDPGSNRHDIVDLTFLSWARLDPQGAIAAVKGTPEEHYAWWAWSAYDPAGAVAAASAENMDRLRNVTWGLGEFQPQWFREHYDELPKEARDNALAGLAKWGDSGDPGEMMEFLARIHRSDGKTFAAWVQKDPFAAYDWLAGKQPDPLDYLVSAGGNLQTIVDSLSETDPDTLQRLIDRAPPGEQKRRIEALVFQRLADSDPAAAMKMAEETRGPKIATDRLALLGTRALREDPDQALEILQKILSVNPSGLNNMTYVEYEGGASGNGGGPSNVDPLVEGLLDRIPGKLLSQQIATAGAQNTYDRISPFTSFASKWADRDPDAFGDWVNQQSDPAVLKISATIMVQNLSVRQDFEAAGQWLQTMKPEDIKPQLSSLLFNWTQNSPDEARAWIQNSSLPQDLRDVANRMVDGILKNSPQ